MIFINGFFRKNALKSCFVSFNLHGLETKVDWFVNIDKIIDRECVLLMEITISIFDFFNQNYSLTDCVSRGFNDDAVEQEL